MSEDSTPTPIEWVNSLQAHLVLAEQHGRTSVQVNVSDFEVLTDVEVRLLTLESEVARLQAREQELTAALQAIADRGQKFDARGEHSKWVCGVARAALAAVSAETEDAS